MSASLLIDLYKNFHPAAYHPGVDTVYANYISRSPKHSNVDDSKGIIFLGLQYLCLDVLIKEWNETFFKQPKEQACKSHKRIIDSMLGAPMDISRYEALHDLGFLPVLIKALPEGSVVPYQVAPMTFTNTHKDFPWVPNMLETVISAESWPMQTAATTAANYYKVFLEYAEKTGMPLDFAKFQGHDFSFRGLPGRHAAAMVGFSHLASGLVGTDTAPAVVFAEKYYNANVDEELVGCSVNATEHSVTCSWQSEGEIAFYRHLLHKVAPIGPLSVVFDTWDFWSGVKNILPELKDEILARDGSFIIRPDSGDPFRILCGHNIAPAGVSVVTAYLDGYEGFRQEDGTISTFQGSEVLAPKYDSITEAEAKGLIECLWDIFGGIVNDKGFKVLHDKIGAIYGDSITLQLQRRILQRLMEKGFASKVVLGIGSYTYQYVTRDTHGSAVKATSVIKNGVREAIFKDPKTDPGKKSAKGLLRVDNTDGVITMEDDVSEAEELKGALVPVFKDGVLLVHTTLEEIRERIKGNLKYL